MGAYWAEVHGMRAKHLHFQLNVCKDMHLPDSAANERRKRILHDINKAFELGADTLVFNEMETETHHQAVRCHPNYDAFVPHGAAGAVTIAWHHDEFEVISKRARKASDGRARITPSRYVNKVKLRRLDNRMTCTIVGTQFISGGWSKGMRPTTMWRRMIWHKDMAVLRAVILHARLTSDYVVWSGDLNRSKINRRLGILNDYNRPTHGRSLYDYLGLLSAKFATKGFTHVIGGFWSDHDGVMGTLVVESH